MAGAWILFTLTAAFLQNARSAGQKHLKGRLGGLGATYVRFVYGAPFACLLLLAVVLAAGRAPWSGATDWLSFGWSVALGGVAQILATFALLRSFDHASFAVGTAFSKTEPIQAALFGVVLLGEVPSLGVGAAIGVGVLGVAAATLRPGPDGRLGLEPRAVSWGLASAALFGISAVSYRAASLSLGGPAWLSAPGALAAATLLQTALMGAWMRAQAADELRAVWAAWRPGLLVGALGAGASACWFIAFTLEPAAHVRTLANVELVFTFAASVLVFGERPTAREAGGVALILVGVVGLLWATI